MLAKHLTKILGIGFLSLLFFIISCQDSRVEYESFLRNHPYDIDRRLEAWGVKAASHGPQTDRPDLAWEQDFLRTMDPALKRPTPERLESTRKQIREYFKTQANKRTGTVEFPWIERGPNNVGGRTRAIMWDPNDATGKKVWAGGVTGGLWFTNDIYNVNASWTQVDDFWDNISISAIAYDPNDAQILYVGTGEGWGAGASRGAGIWKSTDGGRTWDVLTSTSDFHYVNDLEVRDEDGSSVVYAALRGNYYHGWHGLEQQGLQRSLDGGGTWSQVLPIIPGKDVNYVAADIELDANNNLWIGTTDNPYNGEGGGTILFSTDGESWTVMTERNGTRVELACAPSNADFVYALIENNGKVEEVIKTTNGGNNWSTVSEPNDADEGIPAEDFSRGQAWYDLIIAVDPNDENSAIAGAIDLFKTTNGGNSWTQISHWYGGYGFTFVHADQHAIVYKEGSSSEIIFGNDGGVYMSREIDKSSPNIINRNNNYNVTQFYAAAIHPDAGRDYFLAGAQDNGTQQFSSSGLGATSEAFGGDGAYCFIDQNDPNIQIVSYVNNNYYISTNSGSTFNIVSEEDGGSFINPADYDDHLGILYSGNDASSIARLTNIKNGNPTRSELTLEQGARASHLRVSPFTTASTTLFLGTTAGKVYKVTDADASGNAAEITGNDFPDGSVSCIEMGSSENEIMVTFSNYGVNSIWYTSDGGTTWNSKEGDLPDMPVRWALMNPGDENEVILATELGIWRTENFTTSSPNWVPSNIGLANVRVDMLQIRDSDKEIIAATFGRGLFSSSGFSGSATSTILADFSADSRSIDENGTVAFRNKSLGNISKWSWTFEGGTPETSNEQNPTITYTQSGTYDVSLMVEDADGNTNSKTLTEYISVGTGANLTGYVPSEWYNSLMIGHYESDFFNIDGEVGTDRDVYAAIAITNNGTSDITSSFSISIYIDDVLNTKTTWEWTNEEPLYAGYYAYEDFINLGNIPAGTHSLKAVIDVDDDQNELNEADNTVEYEFTVIERCGEDNSLTAESGTISDGSGDLSYLDNMTCSWTIAPKNAKSIALTFNSFSLEKDYDFLYVYNGADLQNPIAELTGSSIPEDITINGQEVVIVMETDQYLAADGFDLDYTTVLYQPDLNITDFTVTSVSNTISFSLNINNDGDLDTDQPTSIDFYYEENEDLNFMESININEVKSGQSQSLNGSLNKPDIAFGTHELFAVIDESDNITESDENNNSASTTFEISELLGLPEIETIAYPNPVHDEFYLNNSLDNAIFHIRDLSGRKLKTGVYQSNHPIDMKSFPNGVYILTIKKGAISHVERVKKL